MTSLLISFHFDVPRSRIEDIFESQNIWPFDKDMDPRDRPSKVYHEFTGVVARYLVEAPHFELVPIKDFLANLPEIRSVYTSDELYGARRMKRNSFGDKGKGHR